MSGGQPDTESVTRIYEVGYHIVPTVKDDEVEKIVGGIRATIEQSGGSFIAEGAPSLMRLAYAIIVRDGEKKAEYDRAYFGWLKFEAPTVAARALEARLGADPSIMRCVVFKTVREDTRARIKAPTLREVKRTDPIRSAPRLSVAEAKKAPVSEEQLDKALETLTAE